MNNKERVVGGAAMSREFKRNSNAYASLPTPKTAKEQRKQQQQQQQQVQIASREPESYGLSNSLSSESIKQACDYYDDEPSDEDLIEIQQTPHGFHSPPSAQSLGFKMPALPLDEECAAFCEHNPEPPLSTPIKQSTAESLVDEEAFNVLNELDAILDVHGNCSSSLNSSATCSDDDKLEHYLMDLDNYLEQLDQDEPPQSLLFAAQLPPADARTRTLPLSGKRKQQPQRQLTEESAAAATSALDAHEFQRGHQMRKTFSCGLTPTTGAKGAAETEGSAAGEVWRRRQSLRRALGQADENTKESGEQVEQALEPHMLLVNLPSERHATQEMRRCLSQEAPPGRALQMLTEAHIFDNLLQNEQRTARAVSEQLEQRPRQYGRRLEGHPTMSPVRGIVSPTSRPQSAPAAQSTRQREQLETPTHAMMSTLCSELSSTRSSRIPSPVSMVSSNSSSSSSSGSDSFTASQTAEQQQLELAQNTQTTMCSAGSSSVSNSIAPLEPQLQLLREKCGFNSYWPHACSRSLALLGCTVGVFNLCRFAVLTINYGGNFLLQFLMLSILFGIPLFWLQMCLGAKIKAGSRLHVENKSHLLWRRHCAGYGAMLSSYLFNGIGCLDLGLPARRLPTPTRSVYRWQELAFPYRYDTNDTGNLTHTVAEYFNVVVLQRLHMAKDMHLAKSSGVRFHVNDRLAFYLALIWAAVFLILCKGLKSLGKLAFLINTLPLMALIAVTGKFVSVVDPASLQNIFTDLDDFLVNSNTWTAAAQETFLTWGLLGASVIAITSRTHATAGKTTLRRDAILIVLLTMLALAAVALLAICCAQILRHHGYIYVPGSFEFPESSTSVYSLQAHTNPQLLSYPRALVPHYSSFIGETYRRNKTIIHIESGFQALRFITELLPAVLSLASDVISWVWAAVAFGMFACFGLAQLCVMWKPISSALGNSTSSVLLSCVTGLLLSIPFATEMGISILYYVDFLLGGAWFIPIIWAAQIFGVFLIRGRPYNGDDLVNDLRMCGSMSAFLALSWNVLLPIGLITLSVIDYKASLSNQFYYWRGKSYFLYWSRKMGSLIQIGIVLIIPVTAIVQIYRYLTSGPADILERIQLLYRPPEDGDELRRPSARQRSALGRRNATTQQQEQVQHELQNDAPPKYTPPPSYTTATGARLAKLLRQSIRRSVRRVLGARPVLTLDAESPSNAAPPDYLTILTNPSGSSVHTTDVVDSSSPESIEIDQRPVGYAQRSQSLGRKLQRPASASSTPTLQRGQGAQEQQRPYTAEDVVTILRSSVRHRPPRFSAGIAHTLPRPPAMSTHLEDASFRSIENLVLNAEPPDQTPGVGVTLTQQRAGQSNNNTSVI